MRRKDSMTDSEMIPDLGDFSEPHSVDWESLHAIGCIVPDDDRIREIIHAAYIDFRRTKHLGKSIRNAEIYFAVPELLAVVIIFDFKNEKYCRMRFEKLMRTESEMSR